jgi:DNA repair protein RadC
MKKFKSTLKEVNALYQVNKTIHNVKISSSQSVNEFIRQVYPVDITYREAMLVLYLNNSNRTLSYSIISIGGLTGAMVDIRLVLRDALLSKATSMILIHNHPSSTLTASNADKTITKRVKDAGLLMDIKLLDHIILTKDSYYSMTDGGQL